MSTNESIFSTDTSNDYKRTQHLKTNQTEDIDRIQIWGAHGQLRSLLPLLLLRLLLLLLLIIFLLLRIESLLHFLYFFYRLFSMILLIETSVQCKDKTRFFQEVYFLILLCQNFGFVYFCSMHVVFFTEHGAVTFVYHYVANVII